MLNSHTADFKEIDDSILLCKFSHHFNLLCGFDIFSWSEVVRYKINLLFVKNLWFLDSFNFLKGFNQLIEGFVDLVLCFGAGADNLTIGEKQESCPSAPKFID